MILAWCCILHGDNPRPPDSRLIICMCFSLFICLFGLCLFICLSSLWITLMFFPGVNQNALEKTTFALCESTSVLKCIVLRMLRATHPRNASHASCYSHRSRTCSGGGVCEKAVLTASRRGQDSHHRSAAISQNPISWSF